MKIVVHGAKGGYNIITPDKNVVGLFDTRPDYNKVAAIGQSAYSIHYGFKSVIFSKYKIIRDVLGDLRTGNVAFSIIVENSEKLSGADVITLLEKVFDNYCSQCIKNDNLENAREDWTFVNKLTNEYKGNGKIQKNLREDDVSKYKQGSIDAAFVYYPYTYEDPQTKKKTTFELEDIFNAPYQDEYTPYRQILFISKDLKNKDENPLNALRNSGVDLTGKVDLENPEYRLQGFHGEGKDGIKIKITNSKGRELHNNDKVYHKEELTIVYSKKHYKDKPSIVGSLSNNEEVRKHLIVKNDNKIDVVKCVDLEPKIKTVEFEFKNWEGKSIDDVEIQIDSQKWEVKKSVTFTAEEIGKHYKISARKENKFLSEEGSVSPETQDVVPIQMHEMLKITVTVSDKNVSDFRIQTDAHKVKQQGNILTFWDESIYKECTIEVTKSDSKNSYSGSIKFTPKGSKSKICVPLTKKEKKREKFYLIDMEEHGKASYHSSSDKNGKDIEVTVKTKGYVFKGFILSKDNKPEGYEGTLVAQYEKQKTFAQKHRTQIIAGLGTFCALGIAVLICWICGVFGSSTPKENLPIYQEITTYIEGDSRSIDRLNEYKTELEKQKPDSLETISGVVWYKPWTLFVEGDKKQVVSSDFLEWEKHNKKIENAIESQTSQPKRQDKNQAPPCDDVVVMENGIEKKEPCVITTYLKTSTDFQSDSIAEYHRASGLSDDLNTSLKLIKDFMNQGCKNCEKFKTNAHNDKFLKENSNLDDWVGKVCKDTPQTPRNNADSSNSSVNPPPSTSPETNKTDEIISYIKGSELNKVKLEEYKGRKDINANLKKSINLYLKFWLLDGTRNNSYSSYQQELAKDSNLKESELKSFVDAMCKKDKPKHVKELPESDQNKSLSHIKNKVQ